VTLTTPNQEWRFYSSPTGINSTTTVDRVTYSSIKNSAVEENDAEAKYYLGLLCLYSLRSPNNDHQDKVCVVNHFRSAAVAGHSTAQCAFGLLYSFGFGNLINQNSLTAIDWFRKATKQSNPHPRSHWLLAKSLYEEWASRRGNKAHGDFNRVDNEGSFRLEEITNHLTVAIRNNIPEAMHLMALLYEYELISSSKSGGDTVLPAGDRRSVTAYKENMAKAAELYQQAARLGFAESNYHLGLMHAYGRGILQNYAAAMAGPPNK
jgi:TPR repeat protein